MSHPIDDFFKQRLSNNSFEDHDQDWPGARVLLELENQKRKRVPWLWWLSGIFFLILIGVTAYSIFTYSGSEANSYSRDEDLASNQEFPISNNTDYDITRLKSLRLTEADAAKLENIENDERDIKSEIDLSKTTFRISEENHNLLIPLSSDIIPFLQLEKTTDKLKSAVPSGGYTDENSAAVHFEHAEEDLFERNERSVLRSDELHHIPAITALKINELLIGSEDHTLPEKIFDSKGKRNDININPGLFFGYDPVRSSIDGGIVGNFLLSNKWSLDLGLGVAMMSQKDDKTYDNLLLNSSTLIGGELVSNNTYRYYSIQFPFRIAYQVSRHNIFLGSIVERPFSLNGRQEVSLIPEMVDMGLASDPSAGLANNPISSRQHYSLKNASQLDRIFFYGQAGYGYKWSPNFMVSLMCTYRFTNQLEVSPLVDSFAEAKKRTNPWGVFLRFDYQFKWND